MENSRLKVKQIIKKRESDEKQDKVDYIGSLLKTASDMSPHYMESAFDKRKNSQ